MNATILLEQPTIDSSGMLTLRLDRQVKVKISADEAHKRVSRFVHFEISSQMHAMQPVLILDDQVYWRVPVHLTLPAFGDVGCVGYIEVDSLTGKLNTQPSMIQQISQKAEELALRFSPPATKSI